MTTQGPLWTCSGYGWMFTRPRQSHSCGPFSVDEYLKGKSEGAIRLCRRFETVVASIGDVMVAPARTRIGFQNCRIFAAVNRIGENTLDVHIVTASPIQHERIRRIEQLSSDCSANHLRIHNEHELDDELREWLRQGYAWGKSCKSVENEGVRA